MKSAKGMAAGLGIPLWGVSSLDVLALAAGSVDLPVRAVLEAGRGRYASGLYERGVAVEPPRLATLDELIQLIRAETLVIGELGPDARQRLQAQSKVRLADPAACLRRAGFLAELGWRMALRGEPGEPGPVDALYIS